MSHTRAWSNTTPENTAKVGLGAQAIREAKVDIDERMSLAHKWNDSQDTDGEHLSDLIYTVSYSSTPEFDLANGWTQKITLTGNVTSSTFTIDTSVATVGRALTIIIVQDGTGSRTFVWPTAVKWPYDVTPTIDTTASKTSIFQFFSIDQGTTWYGGVFGQKYS